MLSSVASWSRRRAASPVIRLVAAYVAWVFAHFAATHAYARFCAPLSLLGLTLSPFVSGAPHCRALRWCIVHGTSTIDAMWMALGTWALSMLMYPPPLSPEGGGCR